MKARQKPLSKFESWLQRIVEWPFSIFPSRLQPTQVTRKLERAMEDNLLLQGEGRRLAPNVYDIYLNIKDHQQLAPGQSILIKDWQDHLVQVARQRHYTLRSIPILRLHPSSDVRAGNVYIEAELLDKQHIGASGVNGEGGIMATQALSAEQLAQLRTQLPPGQNLPGLPGASSPSFQSQPGFPAGAGIAPGGSSPNATGVAASPAMPFAMLTIRLPAQSPNQQTQQAAQKSYHIEKPVVNIGRQLTNDIIVEDKRVSRYHAQIKYQAGTGQFTIFDLGSTNGITVNGTPHLRQHTLRSGDRFTIGSYDFYFERR